MRYPRRRLLLGLVLLLVLSTLPAASGAAQLDVGVLPPVPQPDPSFGIVNSIHAPERAVAAGVR